jgi:lysozyme
MDEAAAGDEVTPTDGAKGRRRRWPYRVGLAVVVLLAIALLGRYVWLPNYRPDLEAGERYGVDVSNHQGTIDWEQVADDDIDFAYIKATEGGDFVDKSFDRNWEHAEDAGLDRGAYHFFTLCKPGAEQAGNFLRTVPSDAELPPAVDLELGGNCAARPDQAWIDRELGAFLTEVESATGERVVLYVGPEFEDVYPITEDLDRLLWHRRFVLRPDAEPWLVWQLQSVANVDGIDGGVDLNVMREAEPPTPP